MYSTAFWCLFVVLLFFLALLPNHCYYERSNSGILEGLLDAPVTSKVFAEKRDSVELIGILSNYNDDHNDKFKTQ